MFRLPRWSVCSRLTVPTARSSGRESLVKVGIGWARGWRPCLACGVVGRQPLDSSQPGLTPASSIFPLCDHGQYIALPNLPLIGSRAG